MTTKFVSFPIFYTVNKLARAARDDDDDFYARVMDEIEERVRAHQRECPGECVKCSPPTLDGFITRAKPQA